MRRAVGAFVLAAAAAIVLVNGVSALSRILFFPTTNPSQEHSQWCWAGTSQAVLSAYGTPVAQCTIANYASGYPGTAGRPDCCTLLGFNDYDNQFSGCNYWNYLYGTSGWGVSNGSIQGILSHWGVNSYAYATSLSQSTTANEISARRPVFVRWGWKPLPNSGGHFVTIYGQESDGYYIDYWDPWPGNGAQRALYSWVLDSTEHAWTHSLQLTTTPTNLPSFTDNPLQAHATLVKAVHITELRQLVASLRARYGLSVVAWTDAPLSPRTTTVKATHIAELRSALNAVYSAMGRSAPSYTPLASGSTVTAAHVAEVRAAVLAVW